MIEVNAKEKWDTEEKSFAKISYNDEKFYGGAGRMDRRFLSCYFR